MAQNKNALIRYKTIDKCLQNGYREWTLENLIEACSDALYEYEGRDINVSKRTVQLDIQTMRSDKLGYNAPIEVYDRKFYRYADPDYSITDIPLNDSDMDVLSETVDMLRQFKEFSFFSELGDIIQRLEDKVYSEKTNRPSVIHLDKNDQLKGLEHLDVLYQAILKEMVLVIDYQSYRARKSQPITLHPYILKEFNNRWFLVGWRQGDGQKGIMTLALDRIKGIDYDLDEAYQSNDFKADEYYNNTYGVTVLPAEHVKEVILEIERSNAPYVLTKPFHHTQEVIEQRPNGSVVISMQVHQNFELERLILGFGSSIKVLAPRQLKQRIKKLLKDAVKRYEEKDLTTSSPKPAKS
jgi:predicted DNA-binding transcriptional regulator YafY